MKIAIYSHSIAPSIDGVCRRFTGILHELARRGDKTLLFTMEDKPLDLPTSTTFVTLDHIIFPSYPNKKVARPTWRAMLKILSWLRSFRPDVIHVVADGFSQMFALAGHLLGIPVVASFHTDILDLLSTHNAYYSQKLCVIFKETVDSLVFDSCATTSKSFSDKLSKQGVQCQHVIMTAVNASCFTDKKRNEEIRRELTFGDDNAFLAVYVGRISNEKRLEVMVDAFRGLKGDTKAYLAIIGDGPSAHIFAKAHGKKNRLYCKPRFLSHEELGEIYASCDVHVSSSQFETLGNTVLEAFACGVPVVVPRTQGYCDTVTHGSDGFLFTPGDSKDAAEYLQRLKDDAQLRADMGAAGKNAMTNRTIENVVRDMMEWYGKGTFMKRNKFFGLTLFTLVLLGCTVPFTIFIFSLYDIMVSYILKPFIHYDTHEPSPALIVSAPSSATLATEVNVVEVVKSPVKEVVVECNASPSPTEGLVIDDSVTEAATEVSTEPSTPTVVEEVQVEPVSQENVEQVLAEPTRTTSTDNNQQKGATSRKNRKGKK